MNALNLHRNVKGCLLHNGYFYVEDVMKHFAYQPFKDKVTEEKELPAEAPEEEQLSIV